MFPIFCAYFPVCFDSIWFFVCICSILSILLFTILCIGRDTVKGLNSFFSITESRQIASSGTQSPSSQGYVRWKPRSTSVLGCNQSRMLVKDRRSRSLCQLNTRNVPQSNNPHTSERGSQLLFIILAKAALLFLRKILYNNSSVDRGASHFYLWALGWVLI